MKESRIHEVRRNEIIEAAQTLFMQQGVEKTSIAQIAAKTGCAKGLFYYYFETKEDILTAIALQQTQFYLKQFKLRLKREGKDSYCELLIVLDTYFQLFPHRSTVNEVREFLDDRLIHQFHLMFTELISETFDAIIHHVYQQESFDFTFPKETLLVVLEGISYLVATRDIEIERILQIFSELLHIDEEAIKSRQSILKNF